MADLTDDELAEIERLCEAATPGPWYVAGQPWCGVLAGSPDGNVGYMVADCEVLEGEREEYAANNGTVPLADPGDDAAFIAAARTALPRLIAEVRRRRG